MGNANIERLKKLLTTDEQHEIFNVVVQDLLKDKHECEEENNKLLKLLEEYEPINEVNTGLGIIYWECDNLLLQQEIEHFFETIKLKYP